MSKQLDIVILHHDEPWECGRPMFDMIEHQQEADMSMVQITLLQDGKDLSLDWKNLLSGYSFPVNVITLDYNCAENARNYAIRHTSAEWIMFCNFDDMFADICSLSMMTQNLPTDKCDLIWMRVIQRYRWDDQRMYINRMESPNFTNLAGKMYRVSFLKQYDLCFPSWVEPSRYSGEHIFNACVLAAVKPFRIMELTTCFYPYYKSYRPGSLKNNPDACKQMMRSGFAREKCIAKCLERIGDDFTHNRAIVKAYCMEYTSMFLPDEGEERDTFSPGFEDFARENMYVIRSFPQADFYSVLDEAETERTNAAQQAYNDHKLQFYFRWNKITTFENWLGSIVNGKKIQEREEASPAEPETVVPEENRDARVVAYCGTYNVYMDMLASCKSLLAHTRVDHVFFLIEDDEFPEPLPDIITCINVKNQQYFKPESPNFDNPWTYMCMIRCAYPEMFPQYDRILSLDIDVVIEDDISDLWDLDLSNYYLAGVPERQRQKTSTDPVYINFGVVMMNLAKLRTDGIQDKLITALNTRKIDCPEQGAFNEFCAGQILPISPEYNYTAYSHITGDALRQRIIHYAGQKFWKHYPNVQKYLLIPWESIRNAQKWTQEREKGIE